MTLSRRDLEEGRMRAIYSAAVDPKRALSDEALSASLARTLAERPQGAGWWVFAYGSLLWNPLFPFDDARPGTVRGVHRSFCLWSMASRGTCEQPGLVLGLEPGGACRGVAYRLPARFAKKELALLWRREMVIGAYRPRWMRVRAAGRDLIALSFVVDRSNLHYARGLSIERKAQVLACAAGAFGSSADYLEHTRIALITHGIVDPYLEALAQKMVKYRHAV